MHSIKILATIPRRKDISEQQFHDHWRHPHGTLSKKIACLRGYVQSHRIVSPLLPDTQLAYDGIRSEEHTSELQSLMRISYAVFCLKKKKQHSQKKKYLYQNMISTITIHTSIYRDIL